MDNQECLLILKALGDDVRIKVFEMLRNGRMCACKIQESFDITQPTLSHHMRILCDSGIVVSEKEGKWVHYAINCEKLNEFLTFIGNTKCRR